MLLTREVRFSLGRSAEEIEVIRANSWSSNPPVLGLAPFLTLQLTVSGTPLPETGYLCDIKQLDQMARTSILPALMQQMDSGCNGYPQLAQTAWTVFVQELSSEMAAESIRLSVSPYLNYSVTRASDPMVVLTQQYEFSASHRLHCTQLSEQENQKVFGKCNHPNGHGHNYVVEVSVGLPQEKTSMPNVAPLMELESVVMREVIDRFDHKYLNMDVEEFRELNPTVENIARTVWQLLKGKLSESSLENVRIYETPKTWADFRG